MQAEKVHLTKEMETNLLALYSRAMDSRSKDPHLRDMMAEEAIKRIDYDFEKTKPNSLESLQVVFRSKQLDLWTAEFLAGHPDTTVLQLGCGLDSRVYRINPPQGVRWFDLVTELRAYQAHRYDKLPSAFRAILRIMDLFPRLRRINRLLRYRF